MSSATAATGHDSEEEDDPPESSAKTLEEVLEEVGQNADARFDEAERERALLARRNEIDLELTHLDEAILSLESEKITACELRDTTVADFETTAGEADERVLQASIDLQLIQRNFQQLLAMGENPYDLINDANNRIYAATEQANEAREAAERAKADCNETLTRLDKQIATLNSQKNTLTNELSSLQ